MQVSAPFLVDAVEHQDGQWAGRVRVDGHVMFWCPRVGSQHEAVLGARASLAAHLKLLFTGATDVEHQQQTERFDNLVELDAAVVLREAAGWSLLMARVQDGHVVAVFQRDWESGPAASAP